MQRPVRKRRTREHVLAELSANYVERQVLLCGWVAERVVHDYGIDLRLLTFNPRGEIDDGDILIQLKASDKPRYRPGRTRFPCRIDRKNLVHWLAQPMPVVLICYDAPRDVAYWVYVQSYFRKQKNFSLFTAGKTVTVEMATSDVVDPDAIRKFGRFRDRVIGQIGEIVHDEDENDYVR